MAEANDQERNNFEGNNELKRVSLRERSRQWFLTVGTVLALLATIIGFLSDSVGVLEFLRSATEPEPAPTEESGSHIVLQLPTDTPQPTATPMPTPTATVVVTPSPTPLPVVAGENERLLLIAQFTNFTVDSNYNVAGRILDALSVKVKDARLEDTRVAMWPEAIGDNATATDVLA
jgi:hypothetical protein